jgi:Sec-independent protein secretion pathway component TatC
MMMIPMLLLFEGSIIVGAMLRKRRLAAQAKEAANNAG